MMNSIKVTFCTYPGPNKINGGIRTVQRPGTEPNSSFVYGKIWGNPEMAKLSYVINRLGRTIEGYVEGPSTGLSESNMTLSANCSKLINGVNSGTRSGDQSKVR